MSGEVIVHPKFKRTDILTLKALVNEPSPPRYSVSHWIHDGMYDEDGHAVLGETRYYLRRLYRDVQAGWGVRVAEGDAAVGERLRTGESPFGEFELCLYEEPDK